jgi:predicted enzyme related to lactoylglutathione lyase
MRRRANTALTEEPVSKIVHFEIPVDDASRASAFYHGVLRWDISHFGDQPYWLVRCGTDAEPGANGALIGRSDLHRSPVLIAGVSDLDAVLTQVASHGGKVLQGKQPVSGVGWSAYIADTEGNTIGLFRDDPSARMESDERQRSE